MSKVTLGLFLWICFSLILVLPVWGQDPNLKTGESRQEPLQTVIVSTAFEGEPTLRFDWGEKKPALAIIKGPVGEGVGKWWIVFDESATISLPDLKEHPILNGVSIEAVPAEEGVVLQVIVDSQRTPVIVQEDHKWQISFKSQPLTIQESATIQLPQTEKEGLVISLKALGKEVRFKDLHTGYIHVVFPSHQVGFGIGESQSFPEFHISAMAQGVGFQLLKDDIIINAASDQATVMHPEGLAITLPREREQARACAIPIGFFGDAQDLDWVDRQRKINEELLDLSHDQHGAGELEIAWLLLSSGQASEALGYLTHLVQMRPSIANLPLFGMLWGVGNLVFNRLPESAQYLLPLREEPEVQIWLSLINALQRPHYFAMNPLSLTQLRSQFQMAKSMLQSYPKPLRSQMVTLILMACIATGDLETLTSFLDEETRPENLKEGEVFDLAKAKVLMSQNKPDAALQMLGELMEKAVSPEVRDIALFDYVVYRLETKMMKEEDAFPQLERLRSQGRGGWLDHRVAAHLTKWKAGKGEIG